MGSRITAAQKTLEDLYTLRWNKKVTIKDILKKMYMDMGMTIIEISKELRVSQGTVSGWLKDFGIPARGWNFPKE